MRAPPVSGWTRRSAPFRVRGVSGLGRLFGLGRIGAPALFYIFEFCFFFSFLFDSEINLKSLQNA
jgi:hypothetical protein